MTNAYDLLVIGSGPGGYPAAIRAASRGKKVGLIEGGLLGGTCLNVGCIPSKALIACAAQYNNLSHLSEFGISVGNVSFDYEKMVDRKDTVVTNIRKSLEGLLKAHGVEIIRAFAKFAGPKELALSTPDRPTVKADKIIIATGSEPRNIQAFPFDGERVLDSTALLNLKKVPKKLLIVGGGVIGCEFASLFQLLGTEITIIEMLPSILPMECPTVSAHLTKLFKRRGIQIETSAKVLGIDKTKAGVNIRIEGGKSFEGELALVAVGRAMNLDKLALDKAGVKIQDASRILVNERMETSAPGIYAVGDIASKWWLAHVATHQGVVAADNACGVPAVMHYNAVPNVIFTYPEIATVGYSLTDAKAAGFDAISAQFPFQALGKAQASGDTEGFSQVVVDQKTGALLGAQIIGHEASALIGEATVAIQNELVIESILETVHPHPTLTEGLMEAAFLASGLPLHLPPKRK